MRSLDYEPTLLHDTRLFLATETYQHYLSKKKLNEALDEAEKLLPIDALGVVMIVHGEEYIDDSVFGASSAYTTPSSYWFSKSFIKAAPW